MNAYLATCTFLNHETGYSWAPLGRMSHLPKWKTLCPFSGPSRSHLHIWSHLAMSQYLNDYPLGRLSCHFGSCLSISLRHCATACQDPSSLRFENHLRRYHHLARFYVLFPIIDLGTTCLRSSRHLHWLICHSHFVCLVATGPRSNCRHSFKRLRNYHNHFACFVQNSSSIQISSDFHSFNS